MCGTICNYLKKCKRYSRWLKKSHKKELARCTTLVSTHTGVINSKKSIKNGVGS